MKVLAYVNLHYGKEYLHYALKSVDHAVDEILILYTATPSYGHSTNIQNPDTRDELREIAAAFSKVKWMDVNVKGEGTQRDLATSYANGKFDIVVALDSDEIWEEESLVKSIKEAYEGRERRYATNHAGWRHFWRSFNEVCRDGFEPIRITNMRRGNNDQGRVLDSVIYHFGYANCEALQAYKMSVHGHKGEISSNWFTQKWLNYRRGETKQLHPASRDIWNETENFDKNTLPDFMKAHPYFNLDKIV